MTIALPNGMGCLGAAKVLTLIYKQCFLAAGLNVGVCVPRLKLVGCVSYYKGAVMYAGMSTQWSVFRVMQHFLGVKRKP